MEAVKFVRVVRTESSEVYILWDGDSRVGQLDLHYAQDVIHGTLIVEGSLARDAQELIVRQIDQELVSSYMPSFDREDFLITVFRGEELEPFSDGEGELEEESELEEEA